MTTPHKVAPNEVRFFLGEFATPAALAAAVRALRDSHRGTLDTHTPYPILDLEEALQLPPSRIPFLVLCGGLSGAILAYLMMWWCNAIDYPINVGGRPENSIPSWIPIMFELTVLFGSFAAFFGLWLINRLPRPHHPLFESDRFRSATLDRFWLSIEVTDPTVDRTTLESDLKSLGALHIEVV